jgi:hypothetical protein
MSPATPVSAIIKQEDVDSAPEKSLGHVEPMTNVPTVSVAEQNNERGVR